MLKPLFITCFFIICTSAIAQQDSTKKSLANNCDVITLKNGSLVYCKIEKIGKAVISYKNCNNPTEIITIPKDSASLINHPDGTYEIIHPSHKEHWQENFIGITYGFSDPVFGFDSPGPVNPGPASTSVDDYSNYSARGEAQQGQNFNVLFYYHIPKAFAGVVSNVGYQFNPFDVDAFTHAPAVSNHYTDLPGTSVMETGLDYKVPSESAGNYSMFKLMEGLFVNSPSNVVSLDVHVLGGLVFCTFPRIAYTRNFIFGVKDSADAVLINKSTTTASALQIGMTIKIYIAKGINFLCAVDYFTCKANFDLNVQYTGYRINYPYIVDVGPHSAATVYYHLFNLTIGLAYSLNWK